MRASAHPRGGGHDRWLLSYADFVTLLFAFFTTMYAISSVDSKKFGPAASSLRLAFEGGGAAQGPVPVQGGAQLASIVPAPSSTVAADALRERLTRELAGALEAGRVEIIADERGIVVSLPESATFAPASTEVTSGARELVARVASAVGPLGHALRIEGHTDDLPIQTAMYRSNWELSTARASAVIAFLVEQLRFDPRRLSAAGYGEFHPRAANDTPANRARNRRVDIVILEYRP